MAAQIRGAGAWFYVTDDDPGPTTRFVAGPLARRAVAAGFEPHLEYTIVLGDGPEVSAIRGAA
jgi:hypothetical protein